MRLQLWAAMLIAAAMPLAGHAQGWSQVELPDGPGTATPVLLDIAMDGSVVWFSTFKDGIMGYDGTTWVLHTQAEGGLRHNQYRYVMFVDSAGDKWTARDAWNTVDRLNDGGTFTIKTDDTWSYYSSPPELESPRVFSMAEDAAGNMWFGIRDENQDQPCVVDLLVENGPGTEDDEWIAFGDQFDPGPGYFSSGDVRGLAIDAANRLWLVFDRHGVDVWDFGDYEDPDDDTIVHYGLLEGLPSDAVRALYLAPDNRMWLGGDNGLAVFDPVDESWTRIDGFPSDRVNDLSGDAQGHIWAATDDGVVWLYSSGEVIEQYDSDSGLAENVVTLIAVDQSDGTVWAVSEDTSTDATQLNVFESGFGPEPRVFVYPNPYREGETDEHGVTVLGAPAGSKVEVFDVAGEKVRELASRREPYRWDSLDTDLNEVPSGVYVIRVEAPDGELFFTKVAIIR
jgi:hypothetical protein